MILEVKNHAFQLSKLNEKYGDYKYTEHTPQALKSFTKGKLNEILKSRNIKAGTKWTVDEMILIILWGHDSKCNHLKMKDGFFNMCKSGPGKDEEGNIVNGRCSLRGGNSGKGKRKKTGSPPESQIGNTNAYVHGMRSSRDKLPSMFENQFNIVKERTELETLMERKSHLEAILRAYEMEDSLGLELIKDKEEVETVRKTYKNEYNKSGEFEDYNEMDYVENRDEITTKYRKKVKNMSFQQYQSTTELLLKTINQINLMKEKGNLGNGTTFVIDMSGGLE